MKKSYFYTPGGEVLAQYDCNGYDKDANSVVIDGAYFYLHDRLGSVRLVINQDGDVNNSYTYNPFGEMFSSECNETVYNPFKFTGQFFDDEIGQYYLRARQYDPVLMRFTARDPDKGKSEVPLSLHRYLYCENEPVNRIDPLGLYYSLPGADDYYDEGETQTVLDIAKDVVGADFTGGPIEAFIWSRDFGPGGMFDYELSGYSFMRAGAELSGSEFGNYLAGYATYHNYSDTGWLCTQVVGDLYELGKSGHFDDPGSKFYIASGVLHAFREKNEKGLRGQLNKIITGSFFLHSLYNYSASDAEGANNALEYGYKFWNYGE